jgi:hypothetical protein
MQEQLFEGAPSPVSPMSSSSSSSSLGNPAVSYSEITIEVDTIPIWGRCYRKRGNLVILKDSTGREDCMRCVHLSLKTPNVLQLHSEGLSKCYTNEEAARAKCPTESDVNRRNRDSDRLGSMKEIMLYRKHIPGGLQSLEHEFCPFNGRYSFNHIVQRGKYGATTSVVCESSLNELGNCPHGDALAVKFRNCPSTSQYGNNMDMSFLCLGDWDHPYNTVVNGERYVALMDLRESPPDGLPKYRCGVSLSSFTLLSLLAHSSSRDDYHWLSLTWFTNTSIVLVLLRMTQMAKWLQEHVSFQCLHQTCLLFHEDVSPFLSSYVSKSHWIESSLLLFLLRHPVDFSLFLCHVRFMFLCASWDPTTSCLCHLLSP